MIVAIALAFLGAYAACGLFFAIPFSLFGVRRLDPHAAVGSWGFRILIVPGTMAFWPLLLKRWVGGLHEPPTERTAHKQPTNPELP